MFAVTVTRPHPCPVLRLVGELDLATVDVLDHELRAALTDDCEQLVVDVGELDFIDVRGLDMIVHGYLQAKARGIALVLRDPSPLAATMIEVTGVDQFLPIERTPLPTG